MLEQPRAGGAYTRDVLYTMQMDIYSDGEARVIALLEVVAVAMGVGALALELQAVRARA